MIYYKTRGPNGPDIALQGILPQSGENPFSGYWLNEILLFSCSVLFSVTADGNHLALPNCKKSNSLLQRLL